LYTIINGHHEITGVTASFGVPLGGSPWRGLSWSVADEAGKYAFASV